MKSKVYWITQDDIKYLRQTKSNRPPIIKQRIEYLLLYAKGETGKEIAAKYGVQVPTVYKWLRRYRTFGIEGLKNIPKSGKTNLNMDLLIHEI